MLEYILANWNEILTAIISVLMAASMIARFTPTESDDVFINYFLKIVHALKLCKDASENGNGNGNGGEPVPVPTNEDDGTETSDVSSFPAVEEEEKVKRTSRCSGNHPK